jgi:hypothetical protein
MFPLPRSRAAPSGVFLVELDGQARQTGLGAFDVLLGRLPEAGRAVGLDCLGQPLPEQSGLQRIDIVKLGGNLPVLGATVGGVLLGAGRDLVSGNLRGGQSNGDDLSISTPSSAAKVWARRQNDSRIRLPEESKSANWKITSGRGSRAAVSIAERKNPAPVNPEAG